MKKKQYILIFVVLIIGAFLGWLIKPTHDHSEHETTSEAGDHIYTCSMHPQIRQKGPGKCPLCGMDLIPASSAGSSAEANPYVLEMTEEAVALANIQTTTVKSGSAANEISLTGKVQINEEKLSTVTAKFPGRIEKLYVNFTGQEVKKGERVASIYSPELITAQKELQEVAKMQEKQPALYQAAKDKLRLWGLSNAQISQIEQKQSVITNFDIFSDVSGFVTQLLVSLGNYVATGTPLAEVADLSTVWIVLDAYETDLSMLKKGAKISFTVQGIPGKEFQATVDYITPLLDQSTRAVEVRAVVPNKDGQLKPEMFVTAEIKNVTNNATSGIAVPATAVLWTGPRSVVYVKIPDADRPAFEMREVRLGPKAGNVYIIESGLTEGEEVVTNGVFAVDGAAQLTGNYSMMSAKSETVEVSDEFKNQLTNLVQKYYSIKNSLVASDPAKAANAAAQFKATLEKVDMTLLAEDSHHKWMEILPMLKKGSGQISNNTELDEQRKAFSLLSERILEAVEVFGAYNEIAYKQYCPMAFDDKGANWLSEIKEIRNPYFGEAMLACGEVKKTYRTGQSQAKESKGNKNLINSHNH